MDGCDTIRAVRTDNRQIGHSNLAPGVLLHQAHSLNAPVISRKTVADLMEQPAIYFVDDLQMPGKYNFEPRERPLFQCLGQQCMIRVRKGVFGNRPSLVPTKTCLVEQN